VYIRGTNAIPCSCHYGGGVHSYNSSIYVDFEHYIQDHVFSALRTPSMANLLKNTTLDEFLRASENVRRKHGTEGDANETGINVLLTPNDPLVSPASFFKDTAADPERQRRRSSRLQSFKQQRSITSFVSLTSWTSTENTESNRKEKRQFLMLIQIIGYVLKDVY
jgi:hypothetical protein